MNEAKKEKLKKQLVEVNLMEQEDTIVECLQANYLKKLLGKIGQWEQGWAYFTERRLVYPTGILDKNIIIPYQNIRQLGKCSQGLFPMGITITYEHPETGEMTTDKFSMMKRQKWIDFMSQKAAIPHA